MRSRPAPLRVLRDRSGCSTAAGSQNATALAAARAEAEAAIEEARAAHKRLHEAFDLLPEGIVFLDPDGRYILWNKKYAEIYKRSADLFEVGARLEDTLRIGIQRGDYPESKGREEDWLAERLAKLYTPGKRHEQWLSDGRCILIEERRTSDGGIIGLRVDITEMTEREASFRLLFDGNPIPMFVAASEGKRILAANDAALEHYGYTRANLKSLTLLDLHGSADHAELDDLYGGGGAPLAGRTWCHKKNDGSTIDVAVYSRPITHDGVPAILLAVIDITERKRAEAQVAYMAHHDALTGLANRTLLSVHLEEMLKSMRRTGMGLAVLALDLDNFKGVNDTLGHPAGDLLLQYVAQRLSHVLREGDIVARLGGDEFAVILTGITSPAEVSPVARRVLETLGAPYELNGHEVIIGASVGIALAPGDGDDGEKLLKNADTALYRAKGDGKGAFRYFEPEMNARAQARRRLETDLRAALASGTLDLHYQPLLNLAQGRITGAEALLRWRHAEKGFISPGEFIPVAEEAGLISAIGDYALKRACNDAASWPGDVRVAVNMSPLQFRMGNAYAAIMEALSSSGLAPHRLEIEITESLFLERADAVLTTLNELRAMGIRIAMDDFGTGYSALSYLRSFPLDKIKIDRSFVRDICANAEQQAIVRAIMSLGSSLDMTITAEGIETEAELAFLRALGCHEGQGFLFSKARPKSELIDLLHLRDLRDVRELRKSA